MRSAAQRHRTDQKLLIALFPSSSIEGSKHRSRARKRLFLFNANIKRYASTSTSCLAGPYRIEWTGSSLQLLSAFRCSWNRKELDKEFVLCPVSYPSSSQNFDSQSNHNLCTSVCLQFLNSRSNNLSYEWFLQALNFDMYTPCPDLQSFLLLEHGFCNFL